MSEENVERRLGPLLLVKQRGRGRENEIKMSDDDDDDCWRSFFG